MKRIILFLFVALSTFAEAQNFDDEKINFSYIQLPTHPVASKYSTFNVIVNKNFDQSNNDSLLAYQARLDLKMVSYDSAMVVWQSQRMLIDRTYLQQMSAWQKARNLGTLNPEPIKQSYSPQPIMPEEALPLIHEDYDNSIIVPKINIEGYTQGASGASVTLDVNPINNYSIVQTISGEGAKMKYNYKLTYNAPLGIKVETPDQGVIYQSVIRTEVQSFPLSSYQSQYDFELYLMDNKYNLWTSVQKDNQSKIAKAVNKELNDKCGFPLRKRYTELYTIKKFKNHTYNDVRDAYKIASNGFTLMGKSRKNSEASGKLNEAAKEWLNILKESNVSDKKSRINKKVTAMLYVSLAEAYLWLNDFDNASHYASLAINGDVSKFKRHAKGLILLIENQRIRYSSNY